VFADKGFIQPLGLVKIEARYPFFLDKRLN